jgi:hypothetical protein
LNQLALIKQDNDIEIQNLTIEKEELENHEHEE